MNLGPGRVGWLLELTKEQQAVVLQKTGKEAKELELTVDELERRTDAKEVGNQS